MTEEPALEGEVQAHNRRLSMPDGYYWVRLRPETDAQAQALRYEDAEVGQLHSGRWLLPGVAEECRPEDIEVLSARLEPPPPPQDGAT